VPRLGWPGALWKGADGQWYFICNDQSLPGSTAFLRNSVTACTEPTCPVHHPKKQSSADDAKWKAEQEKQRKETAIITNTTGTHILAAITAADRERSSAKMLLPSSDGCVR
jgi:hypothetical protein